MGIVKATTQHPINHSALAQSGEEIRGAEEGTWLPGGSLFVVVIGCLAGLIVLAVIAVILAAIRRKGRNRKAIELDWDCHDENGLSKSAPNSRHPSPRLQKRKSCPDVAPVLQQMMIRSMTVENIPDFTLPPERIQPRTPTDPGASGTCLYQQNHIGTLQPDLYRGGNLYDDDDLYLPPSEHGRLWFSMVYDAAVEQLNVTLIKAKELHGRPKDNVLRDPFVKLFLLPDERTSRISKVRKKTLAPIFNETFIFQVPPDDVSKRVLRFTVYDVDKRRVRHCLGHVMVPLKEVDPTKGETMWRDLELHSQASSSIGELQVTLTYIPTTEKVKIVILKARNLREIEYDKETGVYVKIAMLQGRKTLKTKKTMSHGGATDPEFNESFSFTVTGKQMDACSFVITLMVTARSSLKHDHEYGKIVTGPFMFARGTELLHWQDMLAHTRTPVIRWHVMTPALSLH